MSAGGKLVRSVTLRDEQFRLVTFDAGSTPPAWARALITNPSAWESDSAPTPEGDGPAQPDGAQDDAPPAADDQPPADTQDPDGSTDEDLVGELPEPPKRGAGSGKDAWAAYAASKGVTVTDEMSRDDIIAAIEG